MAVNGSTTEHAQLDRVSVLTYGDYRQYLRDLLNEKTEKNSSYSLRSFARQMDLCPSHLSRTFKGTKKLSITAARKISTALSHTAEEADHFAGLVELEGVKNTNSKVRVLKRLAKNSGSSPRVLSVEIFQAVADWHHFALLALTQTKGFMSDAIWMGLRLGLKPSAVRAALERLQVIGLLRRTDSNYEALDHANLTTTDDITSAAIQENHKQHLRLAEKALDDLSVDLREFNNLTLVMDYKDIPKAKKMIRNFMDQFNEELESKPGDEVFQLNLQFHMLSRREKGQV